MKTLSMTQQNSSMKGTALRWATSLVALVFGATALYTLIQQPEALALAAVSGIFALTGWAVFKGAKSGTTASAATNEATTAVANTGLIIAAVALAPLIAFALLWTALLLIIGGAWLLHLIGLA